MAYRLVLSWESVAEYEANLIASYSEDGKKIRQAEDKALTKHKSKNSNKFTLRVPSQKPSGQQFWVEGEHNGFIPPNQRNFNRFPWNTGRLLSTRTMAQ